MHVNSWVSVSLVHASTDRCQWVSGLLELELPVFVIHLIWVLRNKAQVIWKNSKCYELLSHRSSLHLKSIAKFISWHLNFREYGFSSAWKVLLNAAAKLSTWASQYAREPPFISALLFHSKRTWKNWKHIKARLVVVSNALRASIDRLK